METIRFQCPECHKTLRIAAKYAGTRRRCPNPDCGQPITIPLFDETSASDKQAPVKRPAAKSAAAATSAPSRAEQKSASKRTSHAPIRTAGRKQATKPTRRDASKQRLWRGLAVLGMLLLVGIITAYWLPSGTTGDVSPQAVAVQAKSEESFASRVQPFLATYCLDCHGPDLQEEGVRFDQFPAQPDLLADYKLWSKVYQQISVGSMPPQDVDEPPHEERMAVAEWLDKALHRFDCQSVNNPGRVTVHRLNRNEYDNTIRDLLGIDLNLSRDFPSDDVGYGFDNIGDVLSTSPLLMERYLEAAEKAAAAAIILPESLLLDQKWAPNQFKITGTGTASPRELAFASSGQGTIRFETRAPGEYRFRMVASATQAGNEPAKCRIKLNGKEIGIHEVPGHRQEKILSWTSSLPVGNHSLEVAFINDFYAPEAEDPKRRDRNLYIRTAEVKGPAKLEQEHFPAAHRNIVTHRPEGGNTVDYSARKVLQPLLNRAYRRPATLAELDRILRVFQIAQERQESYERSLQIALQAILVSPQFLFRIEELPQSALAKEIQTLGDYELASRLSYFLWSSMPDEELLELARQGQLAKDDILEQQVRRMLADPKSAAFVSNFVGQWLGLRKLAELQPDAEIFPEYTPELAALMPRETELLFADILREDRNLTEFLTADYTFVNELLARHYGIPNVTGAEFRKVSLRELPRRGFVSHAGILTLTSYPDRTSPVKRGEWVLENVLAQAPPPAPNNVPGLEETQKANPNLSFREQLVLHQSDPICSSCHKLMDGIGFGLQNYDAIGRWRDREGEFSIDARGDLPSGESFNGPLELNAILSSRPDDFTRCLTEKMLTYALGRGLEWYDRCTVDDIISATRADGYRISRVVVGIVQSPPFRSQKVMD
ncbi:MAG: DUF1592 domain-containing protein [Planctomycetaceae bacterium]|nr:DUF1592 domain-containing protein [Planctomycetaceae bacterium]